MYIKALECVRLGDSNVQCYDVFMSMMKEVYTTLLPLSAEKDGMGLAEREEQIQSGANCHYEEIQRTGVPRASGDGQSSCSGIDVRKKQEDCWETDNKPGQTTLRATFEEVPLLHHL